MHNDFTLFYRTYPNKKKVVFYYAYDGEGVRHGPWTTKCLNLTKGRNYCNGLLKKGGLIPDKTKAVTFGEFAKGFWERGSEYLANQEGRRDISTSYIKTSATIVTHQILPFFGKAVLADLTEAQINGWILGFKKRGRRNSYANSVFSVFRIMLGEAVRRGLVPKNPCDNIRRLKNDRKKLEIITVKEAQMLFPEKWETVWGEDELVYVANRLASLTGLRIGEILGLRGDCLFDDYIHICGQYGDYGFGPTKTKETRSVPIIPEMAALLIKLKARNGDGYLFSENGGAVPIKRNYVYKHFHTALQNIGLDEAEIKRRGLCIHTWRHFVNTELQRQGLSLLQVQAVTGHKSARMSELYNHPDARSVPDVMRVQKAIAGITGAEPETAEGGSVRPAGNILIMPVPEPMGKGA